MTKFLGIIGGSGLYEMEGLTDITSVAMSTPFGDPSDEIITGVLGDMNMAFLHRHGKGHRITPSEINYRANIYALKTLGVDSIIAVSAVGSMKEEIVPGDLVVPHQFNDRTKDAGGLTIPVEITVFADRTFTFITKSPPASVLLKRAAQVAKGSSEPNKDKVGKVTPDQVFEIVKTKFEDMNAFDEQAAFNMVAGTARSMGIEIEG